MIISSGKNDFVNNTFDKYRWSANTYETPEEIHAFFTNMQLTEKRIKSISAIGAMLGYGIGDCTYPAIEILRDAGMITKGRRGVLTFSDGTEKSVKDCKALLGNVSIERKFTGFEPIIISFEDDSTLEMLPCEGKGLRLSCNAIPKSISDGMNHRDFDIGILFNEYISGRKCFAQDIVTATRVLSYSGLRKDTSFSYRIYRFDIDSGTLIVEANRCCEYEITFSHSSRIKCGELQEIKRNPNNYSLILDVPHGGGAMNIYPVVGKNRDEEDMDMDCPDTISVCYFLPRLVDTLMYSYFDSSLPINKERSQGYYDHYYRNYYTKDSILQMMDEVERELPAVDQLSLHEKCEKFSFRKDNETDAEIKEWIDAEIDYTKRFIARMRGMALNTPEYNYICFAGP